MRPLALSLALLLGITGQAAAEPSGPAPGPVRVIGSQGAGCVAGAVELPDSGPGFAQIRQSRSSFWGTPATIANLELLGARAQQAGLPVIYMGDISAPRGGPLRGGHFSHQMGIDADVWLDLRPKPALDATARQDVDVPSLVAADGRGIDPAQWRPEVATLLRLTATLPHIDRVLVNAAIKRELCRTVTGDRSWLHLVRPWFGHSAHMHIRFQCPPDQKLCVQAPPPPPGEGCDASLDWWFAQLDKPPAPATSPAPPVVLPAACTAIMQAP